MTGIIRRTAVHGVVRDPLTGAAEFTTTDQTLAEHVARVLDEQQPIYIDRLYRLFAAIPKETRSHIEWVMTKTTFRSLGTNSPYIFGLPVALDDHGTGVTLRTTTRNKDVPA